MSATSETKEPCDRTLRAVRVAKRSVEVVDRYAQGQSMWHIARTMCIPFPTVHRDILTARKNWKDKNILRIEAIKEKELDKIDQIEARAVASYELSLRESSETITGRTTGDHPSEMARITKKQQAGEATFLMVLLKCVEMRCKVLGLFAPRQADITSAGQTIKIVAGIDLEAL